MENEIEKAITKFWIENYHPDILPATHNLVNIGIKSGYKAALAANTWVAVKDGLPTQCGSYLVTCSDGSIRSAGYWQNRGQDQPTWRFPYSKHSADEIIAWRPRPQPYTPEDNQ